MCVERSNGSLYLRLPPYSRGFQSNDRMFPFAGLYLPSVAMCDARWRWGRGDFVARYMNGRWGMQDWRISTIFLYTLLSSAFAPPIWLPRTGSCAWLSNISTHKREMIESPLCPHHGLTSPCRAKLWRTSTPPDLHMLQTSHMHLSNMLLPLPHVLNQHYHGFLVLSTGNWSGAEEHRWYLGTTCSARWPRHERVPSSTINWKELVYTLTRYHRVPISRLALRRFTT